MPYQRAVSLYEVWVNSNYVATPFGTGALLLEPWWVERVFTQLNAIDAWYRRQKDRRDEARERRRPPKEITFDDI